MPVADEDSGETGTPLTARNRWGSYSIPAGLADRPAARAALAGEVYEADTIDFMRRHAADGDIIHAGTFFGDFLPALSHAMAPGARIWAFEPNPDSYGAAERTMAMNSVENVSLTNAALSNGPGALFFRTHSRSGRPLGGLSRIVDGEGPGVLRVPSVMLDYAVPIDRKVSILQLDVEGHERQALKGAYHIIQIWRPILILEHFHQLQWLTRTFRGLNYNQIGKLHGNFVYATEPLGDL